MNAVQEAAHRALNLPLWIEWEEFCRSYVYNETSVSGNAEATASWGNAVARMYGGVVVYAWRDGSYPCSDCLLSNGDLYVWIP